MEIKDLIIIGAGPAGINAGIYAKRSNVSSILIFNDDTSSLDSDIKIENFYSRELISGKELKQLGINQARRLGIEVIDESILHIEVDYSNFNIKVTSKENTYQAKALILATGRKRISLNLSNIKELEKEGVSYCATCDGFFYKNKKVGVIGAKDFALNEYNYLKNIVSDIKLLTNGEDFSSENYKYEKLKISSINKNIDTDKLKISYSNGVTETFDGLFIALGNASSSDFAKQLGIALDSQNNIMVDENNKTNYKNIFACGDNTKGQFQISKALFEGMKAGTAASKYLRNIK